MKSHIHVVSRRSFLIGATAVTSAALGAPVLAQMADAENNGWEELFNNLVDGSEQIDGSPIYVDLPEIAENGNQVQFSVAVEPMDGVFPISAAVFVTGNPRPMVGTFNFHEPMGVAGFTSRMRLGQTQQVVVVANMGNGKMAVHTQEVKVTIGGCGG